jgi:hypothetical protein
MDAARVKGVSVIAASRGLLAGALLLGLGLPAPVLRAVPLPDTTTVLIVVDSPTPGSTVGSVVLLQGWAADPTSEQGTGVAGVYVYLDGERGTGRYLGRAPYGLSRPDVAQQLGAERYRNSGFALPLVLPPGPHTLYVYAQPSDPARAGEGSSAVPVALLVNPVASGTAAPALPPVHCAGLPAPFGVYPLETPQSYGAIYPTDVPFVFGDPWFWATYANPAAPAYIDLRSGIVYPNAYFYQPRPARGIPLAC